MHCAGELQAWAFSQCDVKTVAAAWRAFSVGTVATVFRSLDAAHAGLDSVSIVGTTCLRRSLQLRATMKELVQMAAR